MTELNSMAAKEAAIELHRKWFPEKYTDTELISADPDVQKLYENIKAREQKIRNERNLFKQEQDNLNIKLVNHGN